MSQIDLTAEVLTEMAETFKERNATYADNTPKATDVIMALWPSGVPPETVADPIFHLLVLKCVKLARFVNTGLTHLDSIHDDGVYSAMICSMLKRRSK